MHPRGGRHHPGLDHGHNHSVQVSWPGARPSDVRSGSRWTACRWTAHPCLAVRVSECPG